MIGEDAASESEGDIVFTATFTENGAGLLPRLLMYGCVLDYACDLPIGAVLGVRADMQNAALFSVNMTPVGFDKMRIMNDWLVGEEGE